MPPGCVYSASAPRAKRKKERKKRAGGGGCFNELAAATLSSVPFLALRCTAAAIHLLLLGESDLFLIHGDDWADGLKCERLKRCPEHGRPVLVCIVEIGEITIVWRDPVDPLERGGTLLDERLIRLGVRTPINDESSVW